MQFRSWQTLAVAFLLPAAAAIPALGDQYILPIYQLKDMNDGTLQVIPGGGYNGHDAYFYSNIVNGQVITNDIGRFVWRMPDNAPQHLYKIEWWGAPGADSNTFQPFESAFDGQDSDGQVDPNIPWHGQFNTNHQYLDNDVDHAVVGAFNATGPGPQAPGDANDPGNVTPGTQGTIPNREPLNPWYVDGTLMWLTGGSEIYAAYNLALPMSTTLADLRVTLVNSPEPASFGLLGLWTAGLLARRRRMP